eukprot:UN02483
MLNYPMEIFQIASRYVRPQIFDYEEKMMWNGSISIFKIDSSHDLGQMYSIHQGHEINAIGHEWTLKRQSGYRIYYGKLSELYKTVEFPAGWRRNKCTTEDTCDR